MTQLNSVDFKTQTTTLFPTNGSGAISATDLRTQMDNLADSAAFIVTGQTTAPAANDDDSNTGTNGYFQVGHVWVDETNDIAYVCLDNSTGAAIWISLIELDPSIVPVTTSRNLALTDARDILEIDTTSGVVALTIPTNASIAFPIGTKITVTLLNTTNAATLAGDTGVTLNGVSAGSGIITATAYSKLTFYKRGTDAWVVQGDIGVIA